MGTYWALLVSSRFITNRPPLKVRLRGVEHNIKRPVNPC